MIKIYRITISIWFIPRKIRWQREWNKKYLSKIDEVYGEYGFIAYNDGGIIKDLTLRGEYEITGTNPDYSYAGGLTGYNKNGEISNCKTDINI